MNDSIKNTQRLEALRIQLQEVPKTTYSSYTADVCRTVQELGKVQDLVRQAGAKTPPSTVSTLGAFASRNTTEERHQYNQDAMQWVNGLSVGATCLANGETVSAVTQGTHQQQVALVQKQEALKTAMRADRGDSGLYSSYVENASKTAAEERPPLNLAPAH